MKPLQNVEQQRHENGQMRARHRNDVRQSARLYAAVQVTCLQLVALAEQNSAQQRGPIARMLA